MEAYKYIIEVDKHGQIKIPYIPQIKSSKVEVIILPYKFDDYSDLLNASIAITQFTPAFGTVSHLTIHAFEIVSPGIISIDDITFGDMQRAIVSITPLDFSFIFFEFSLKFSAVQSNFNR